MKDEMCPCGGDTLARCCGRWSAMRPPDSPEALMRARYTAYTREDSTFLLGTWHPLGRPSTLDFQPGTQWLGLKIDATTPVENDQATVTFTARWRVGGGRAERQTEVSRFVRVHGLWWYVDGEVS